MGLTHSPEGPPPADSKSGVHAREELIHWFRHLMDAFRDEQRVAALRALQGIVDRDAQCPSLFRLMVREHREYHLVHKTFKAGQDSYSGTLKEAVIRMLLSVTGEGIEPEDQEIFIEEGLSQLLLDAFAYAKCYHMISLNLLAAQVVDRFMGVEPFTEYFVSSGGGRVLFELIEDAHRVKHASRVEVQNTTMGSLRYLCSQPKYVKMLSAEGDGATMLLKALRHPLSPQAKVDLVRAITAMCKCNVKLIANVLRQDNNVGGLLALLEEENEVVVEVSMAALHQLLGKEKLSETVNQLDGLQHMVAVLKAPTTSMNHPLLLDTLNSLLALLSDDTTRRHFIELKGLAALGAAVRLIGVNKHKESRQRSRSTATASAGDIGDAHQGEGLFLVMDSGRKAEHHNSVIRCTVKLLSKLAETPNLLAELGTTFALEYGCDTLSTISVGDLGFGDGVPCAAAPALLDIVVSIVRLLTKLCTCADNAAALPRCSQFAKICGYLHPSVDSRSTRLSLAVLTLVDNLLPEVYTTVVSPTYTTATLRQLIHDTPLAPVAALMITVLLCDVLEAVPAGFIDGTPGTAFNVQLSIAHLTLKVLVKLGINPLVHNTIFDHLPREQLQEFSDYRTYGQASLVQSARALVRTTSLLLTRANNAGASPRFGALEEASIAENANALIAVLGCEADRRRALLAMGLLRPSAHGRPLIRTRGPTTASPGGPREEWEYVYGDDVDEDTATAMELMSAAIRRVYKPPTGFAGVAATLWRHRPSLDPSRAMPLETIVLSEEWRGEVRKLDKQFFAGLDAMMDEEKLARDELALDKADWEHVYRGFLVARSHLLQECIDDREKDVAPVERMARCRLEYKGLLHEEYSHRKHVGYEENRDRRLVLKIHDMDRLERIIRGQLRREEQTTLQVLLGRFQKAWDFLYEQQEERHSVRREEQTIRDRVYQHREVWAGRARYRCAQMTLQWTHADVHHTYQRTAMEERQEMLDTFVREQREAVWELEDAHRLDLLENSISRLNDMRFRCQATYLSMQDDVCRAAIIEEELEIISVLWEEFSGTSLDIVVYREALRRNHLKHRWYVWVHGAHTRWNALRVDHDETLGRRLIFRSARITLVTTYKRCGAEGKRLVSLEEECEREDFRTAYWSWVSVASARKARIQLMRREERTRTLLDAELVRELNTVHCAGEMSRYGAELEGVDDTEEMGRWFNILVPEEEERWLLALLFIRTTEAASRRCIQRQALRDLKRLVWGIGRAAHVAELDQTAALFDVMDPNAFLFMPLVVPVQRSTLPLQGGSRKLPAADRKRRLLPATRGGRGAGRGSGLARGLARSSRKLTESSLALSQAARAASCADTRVGSGWGSDALSAGLPRRSMTLAADSARWLLPSPSGTKRTPDTRRHGLQSDGLPSVSVSARLADALLNQTMED